jgi:death-on-curing protein
MIEPKDVKHIIELHNTLIKDYGGLSGLKDFNLLASALTRPFRGTADGMQYFPYTVEKASAILEALIKYYPFWDGNKRLGIIVTSLFLYSEGFRWKFNDDEIVSFAIDIAENKLSFDEIKNWIEKRIVKI